MSQRQEHKRTKCLADTPIELLMANILPRLPIQTILRFKAVSKGWYNTISSLKFVEARLNCKSTLPQRVLLRKEVNNKPRILTLSYNDNTNTLVNLAELDCDGISEYRGGCYIVDSCNGLLCLSLLDVNHFAIWNPVTHQYKEIPYCEEMFSSRKLKLTVSGFGYSDLSHDYKIFAFFSKTSPSYMAYQLNPFYVFSFRSGIWKELTDLNVTHFTSSECAGVWIKGKVYWAWNDYATGNAFGLFSFDLATETMNHISISDHFSEYGYKWVKHIFEIDGFLSFSCFKEGEPNHIWKICRVEGVDTWVKVFEFDSPNFSVFGIAGIESCFAHFVGKLKLLDLKGDGINDGGGGDNAYDSIEGIEYRGSAHTLQKSSSYVETFGAFKIQAPK